MDKRTSDTINIVKGFAILFVVCAHCNYVNDNINYLNKI